MNWICENCQTENDVEDKVCGACMKLCTPNAELVETEKDRIVAAFSAMPTPSWSARMFSLNHRITRLDFAMILLLSIIAYLAALVSIALVVGESGSGFALVSWVLILVILIFYGGKRCMDMGFSRWGAIPGVILTLGILFLLFARGDEGANRFGPSPIKPGKSKQPVEETEDTTQPPRIT